jgi:hypothetical protein
MYENLEYQQYISESPKRLQVKFPEKLCIYTEHYRDICLYILSILTTKAATKNEVFLDLSHVKQFSAAGAVALFARVTSLQITTGRDALITTLPPKDYRAKKLFNQSGLWSALKPGGKRKLGKLWDTDIRFKSGTDQSKHLDPTLELIDSLVSPPARLKEAIQEALLNITQHAYSDINNQQIVKRWWQYCTLDREQGRFNFVLSDLGMTIPKKFYNPCNMSDADLLVEAMKLGITSTGSPWRGKGSKNIKDPVESKINDKLIVISRMGLYIYNTSQQPEEAIILPTAYNGTLIAWSFDLTGVNV